MTDEGPVMNRAIIVVVTAWVLIGCGVGRADAQGGDTFSARLSVVPVDAQTTRTTSGLGSVTAVLIENRVFLTGSFDGMNSAAIAAHLHRGSKGQRGPIAFQLSVGKGTTGVLGGGIELTEAEVQDLMDGNVYVQIHTEGNPGGELRGWLLRSE